MHADAATAASRSSSATAFRTRCWCSTTGARPAPTAHELRSELFPGSEGYVRDTKTIVTYDLDLQSGSASLDAKHPSFSTQQSRLEQYWEFFRLGAEHLYTGIDHILFLLALIAGSRRLREIVLAATTFTLAHSVTFILAALGLVHVPASIVEPVIALSIAVVAGLHLWRLWQRGSHAVDLEPAGQGRLGLDAAGWTRLAMVFCFGLVHGLGFASALGIDRAFSWTLLSSLFVFNLGIESVQLGDHRGRLPGAGPAAPPRTARRALGDRRDRRGVCARWAWCGSCSARSRSEPHRAHRSRPACSHLDTPLLESCARSIRIQTQRKGTSVKSV